MNDKPKVVLPWLSGDISPDARKLASAMRKAIEDAGCTWTTSTPEQARIADLESELADTREGARKLRRESMNVRKEAEDAWAELHIYMSRVNALESELKVEREAGNELLNERDAEISKLEAELKEEQDISNRRQAEIDRMYVLLKEAHTEADICRKGYVGLGERVGELESELKESWRQYAKYFQLYGELKEACKEGEAQATERGERMLKRVKVAIARECYMAVGSDAVIEEYVSDDQAAAILDHTLGGEDE